MQEVVPIPYDPVPKDHRSPDGSRTYQGTDGRWNVLGDIFDEWADSWSDAPITHMASGYPPKDDPYEDAVSRLEEYDHAVTAEDIYPAIARHEQDTMVMEKAGLFVSAMVNTADTAEMHFQYDADLPVGGLGYRLDADNTLFIDGNVSWVGEESSGMIVHDGDCDELAAKPGSAGLVINRGTTERFGYGLNGGLRLINTGTVTEQVSVPRGRTPTFISTGDIADYSKLYTDSSSWSTLSAILDTAVTPAYDEDVPGTKIDIDDHDGLADSLDDFAEQITAAQHADDVQRTIKHWNQQYPRWSIDVV